jgi:hypothetical protein
MTNPMMQNRIIPTAEIHSESSGLIHLLPPCAITKKTEIPSLRDFCFFGSSVGCQIQECLQIFLQPIPHIHFSRTCLGTGYGKAVFYGGIRTLYCYVPHRSAQSAALLYANAFNTMHAL